ncbi:hypothetical protein [Arthrobacter sp. JZ12]|uniref:hypothetical protein n=1 Tax=Arthrobacter sp. JZ12 TaxID=2654190 RepID=UPI002B46939F|nr:hypothetical protein [Arthrobacter sp. JZ12]
MSTQPKGVKGPLIFSAVLAAIAGIATMVFSTGGGTRELRIDLGLTAAGIAFIASLLISALLLMTEKPNDEHLGKGTGINRSSAKIRGGASNLDEHGRPRGTDAKNNDDDARP